MASSHTITINNLYRNATVATQLALLPYPGSDATAVGAIPDPGKSGGRGNKGHGRIVYIRNPKNPAGDPWV